MEKDIVKALSARVDQGEDDLVKDLLELVKKDPFLLRTLKDEDKTREICRAALEFLPERYEKYDLLLYVPFSDVCLETLQKYCMNKTDAILYAINIPNRVMNEKIAEFICTKNPLAFPILKDTTKFEGGKFCNIPEEKEIREKRKGKKL